MRRLCNARTVKLSRPRHMPNVPGRKLPLQKSWSNLERNLTPSGRFVLDHLIIALGRLAAARALGERGFDFLDGLGLGNALHR